MRLWIVGGGALVFALACQAVPADTGADPFGVVPGSAPPVAWYVTRDAEGDTTDGYDWSVLCGDATFFGSTGGAAACMDDNVHGVLSVMSDEDGQTWPDDLADEAALCPDGWTWVGGNGLTATCTRADAAASVFLYYGTDGAYYEDVPDRGDICPAGWAYVGGAWYGAPLCVADDQASVTPLYENTAGDTIDALADPADTCAEGWDFLGTWYGNAQCAHDGGTVITLYQRPDGATVDDVSFAEMCGDGWIYVGAYYGYAVCWTADTRATVTLNYGADGAYFGAITDGPAVCPMGWEVLGAVGGAVVCGE
jgi:hypothetical protein